MTATLPESIPNLEDIPTSPTIPIPLQTVKSLCTTPTNPNSSITQLYNQPPPNGSHTKITKLLTKTALTVPAPNRGISKTLTTKTSAPRNPPIHCHHGPERNTKGIFIPWNPREYINRNMKQHRVPTKKDWRDAKEGFEPGVRALRAFTPP
jgi:hypothetical protein